MSFTYTAGADTDLNWVRFLIGDTVDTATSPATFQDEEINLVIAEESVEASGQSLKYFAAAAMLGVLLIKFGSMGKGLVSKTVSRLSKTWGVDSTSEKAISDRISYLRQRGAWLLTSRSRIFQVLGRR